MYVSEQSYGFFKFWLRSVRKIMFVNTAGNLERPKIFKLTKFKSPKIMSRVSWDIAAQSHEILRVFVWWSLTAYTWLYFFSSDVILIRHLHVSPSASYLPPPPPHQILHNHCFSFELQPSQEKLKTMLIQNLGGGAGGWKNKVPYGRCASGECEFLYKLIK